MADALKGYKKKPLAITLVAIGFFLIPVAMLVQVFTLSRGSWEVLEAVLRSDYFLREWVLSWSAAWAIYAVTRFSFVAFVSLSLFVLVTKVSRLMTHPDLENPFSVSITLFWLSVALYFLLSSLKAPYLNPKLRWWTRPARIPKCRQATILYEGVQLPVTVLNLSLGGAFVRLNERMEASRRFPQRLGEEFEFTIDGAWTSKARLVWKGVPEGPYRNGMGIQFVALSREGKRQLKGFLKDAW